MATAPNQPVGQLIRVLLVDDSPLLLELIRRMLASAPDIDVVGCASDGVQALALVEKLQPDVVCTDLHMPRMDGLALTRALMASHPLPILILSVSVQAEQEHNIFQMLDAGALDILAKPRSGSVANMEKIARDLVTKIRVLAGVKIIGKRSAAKLATPLPPLLAQLSLPVAPRLIGIGASTGGPQAFDRILRHLPRDFPVPLLCVQHIAQGFVQGLVSWLASSSPLRICIAREGESAAPGTAYFGVDDRHIEVDAGGRFHYSDRSASAGHRPSIDIALASIAQHYGSAAVGVLLTGMGQDGAQGLLEIQRAGGLTIAQDEASSVIFGMPRRAIELGAARHVLDLSQIAAALCALAGGSANADQGRV